MRLSFSQGCDWHRQPALPLEEADLPNLLHTLSEHPKFLLATTTDSRLRRAYSMLAQQLHAIAPTPRSLKGDAKTFLDIVAHKLALTQWVHIQVLLAVKPPRLGEAKEAPVDGTSIALLRHMLDEQDHVMALYQQRLSIGQELNWLLREATEHTQLLGQSLDPDSRQARDTSRQTLHVAETLEHLSGTAGQTCEPYVTPELYQALQQSNDGAKRLVKALAQKVPAVRSSLTRDMIRHEMRESQFANARLLRYAHQGLAVLEEADVQDLEQRMQQRKRRAVRRKGSFLTGARTSGRTSIALS
jgi:hypothetical protein